MHARAPNAVSWHRDLPPVTAEVMDEHVVEATSQRVSGSQGAAAGEPRSKESHVESFFPRGSRLSADALARPRVLPQ